jgi:hypothetical protein
MIARERTGKMIPIIDQWMLWFTINCRRFLRIALESIAMSPWYTKRRPGNSRRFETFGSVRLGSEPFSVPGKQSGHTDVRQLHQGLDPALQTDGESAVGRHPASKCFKVPLEAFGIYVPGLHGLQVCRFCMEPLSPGYQLLPRKSRSKLLLLSGRSGRDGCKTGVFPSDSLR